MIYKALLAQKVIAKLLHEFFSVVCCKVIAPGKHGISHFYTLSALCYKNAQKKSAFWTLYLRLFNGGETRIRTGDKGFAGLCLTTWPSRRLMYARTYIRYKKDR